MSRRNEGVPQITVVVPCRNEAGFIGSLLEALRRQDVSDFEVIVAEGGSEDGSPAIIDRYAQTHPELQLTVLHNPKRTIPAGLNLAIQEAQAGIVARLDAHCRPDPGYLRRCLQALAHTGAAVVGGRWEIIPGARGPIAKVIATAVSSPLGAGDARYRLQNDLHAGPVDTVPFGCFRRETWAAMGGFNESLLTNEDYEFYYRVRRQGGIIYLDPTISSQYYARPTYRALAAQYWRYGWWKAQMLKRYPRSVRWRQALPLTWAAAATGSIVVGGLWPASRPLVLIGWGAYLGSLLGGAVYELARRDDRLILFPALAAAYGLIHFSWGLGGVTGLLFGPNPTSPSQNDY